jgi:hypothetical protein
MTLKKAKALLEEKYKRACELKYVDDPVAWALYHTWKAADKEREKTGWVKTV